VPCVLFPPILLSLLLHSPTAAEPETLPLTSSPVCLFLATQVSVAEMRVF